MDGFCVRELDETDGTQTHNRTAGDGQQPVQQKKI